MSTPFRTRFAPSPTGALHCGTVRTALFAWLLARHDSGQFILRIEDTDQKREVNNGVANITETLQWLGLTWDEGPGIEGPHSPYVQSQRLATYRHYAQLLYDQGLAYADPYTPEELEQLRTQAQAEKRPFLYREHRPESPPAWDGTQPLRIKLEPKAWAWDDAVMGHIEMGAEMIDDYIIIKADGFPTYNFCHIIDDHEMDISHVLRSQEFLSSIPKFLATHEVLGWAPPINAVVPPVLGEEGGSKLSKRKGALPVLHYRDQGYIPEALINFIASLGWNDGTEQEVFTRDELIAKFSLDRVQTSPARFDERRLIWFNGQHIRMLDLEDLYQRVADFWPVQAQGVSEAHKKSVLALVQERLKTLRDLPDLTHYFFAEPTIDLSLIDTNKQLKRLARDEQTHIVQVAIDALGQCNDWQAAPIQDTLNTLLETTGQKPSVVFSLIRLAITWAPFSPQLNDSLALLGKDTSLARLQHTRESLQASS